MQVLCLLLIDYCYGKNKSNHSPRSSKPTFSKRFRLPQVFSKAPKKSHRIFWSGFGGDDVEASSHTYLARQNAIGKTDNLRESPPT